MSHILHFLLRLCLYQQAPKFGRDLSSIQDPFKARLRNLTSAQLVELSSAQIRYPNCYPNSGMGS